MPGWAVRVVVACVVLAALLVAALVVAWRRTLAQVEASGLRYRLRCEGCGHEFELAPRAYARFGVVRSRSVTRTEAKGPALVNKPRYAHLAKRLDCPACGKRCWCEVLNANEAQDVVAGIALRNFGAALALLVVVGFVLRALLT